MSPSGTRLALSAKANTGAFVRCRDVQKCTTTRTETRSVHHWSPMMATTKRQTTDIFGTVIIIKNLMTVTQSRKEGNNMTRFEERGIDRQYSSRNAREAKVALEKSCEICATQGKHISCAYCMIASVHQLVTEIFTK